MARRVNTKLLTEICEQGAPDILSCFNCGNCTAVCPLSEDQDAFPRRMVRYAQLGMSDHLIASKELWLCHYCGDCSVTCPREAGPAEFMAAARRHAIAGFDPFGLAKRLYRSAPFMIGTTVGLFLFIAAILMATSPGIPAGDVRTATMLDFLPFDVIHDMGMGVFLLMGATSMATLINMLWLLSRSPLPTGAKAPVVKPEGFPLVAAVKAFYRMARVVLGHDRQRSCGDEEAAGGGKPSPKRWLMHAFIFLGFMGLGLATVLDFMLKDPDAHVALWSPIRLLGTIAGAVMVWGVTVTVFHRLFPRDKYHSYTHHSDWLLLAMLWIVAVTGFVLEIAIYVPTTSAAFYYVFLVHVALAMELLMLLPFTKFAHAICRPTAIWFQEFRRLRAADSTQN